MNKKSVLYAILIASVISAIALGVGAIALFVTHHIVLGIVMTIACIAACGAIGYVSEEYEHASYYDN